MTGNSTCVSLWLLSCVLLTPGCSTHRDEVVADPEQISRGKAAFHDHALAGLGGNGRSCSDCHRDSNAFQLSPSTAEERFQQMTDSGTDDPLFRPVDADDLPTNGLDARL